MADLLHQPSVDYLYKILLLGSSAVGKSSLLVRFADDTFNSNQAATIGVDWKIRTVDMDSKRIKLQLWDSAGQERFRTIASSYYRGAHGVAVVFDITKECTFLQVESWLEEISQHASDGARRILIGNKSDLEDERAVDATRARDFAKSVGMQYIETSAKNSDNVTEAFLAMTREIYENVGNSILSQRDPDALDISPLAGKSVSKRKCC